MAPSVRAPIPVALVGVGRWGRQLLRVFNDRGHVVRCCYRGRPETQRWLQEHYPQVERGVDYEEVLRDRRVEAVIIATPIATHAALARRALEAGKHVFVEKPMATNPAEAQELAAIATRGDRVLFVGHVFLFHPVLKRLRQVVRADGVRSVAMSWSKLGTFEEDLFWNLMSHEVAIAVTLFGGGPSQADVLHVQGVVTTCDVAAVSLRFGADRACFIHISRCAAMTRKHLTLTTDSGRVLTWDDRALFQLSLPQGRECLYTSTEEPLACEVEAFLRRVRGEGPADDEELAIERIVVEVIDRLCRVPEGAGR